MPGFAKHRDIWRIAGPVMLGNFSVPLVGVVDTAVVGHLSDARYLATVAFGAATVSLVFFLFGFLRMGTGGLVAQASGAGDADELGLVSYRALALGLLLGAVIALASPGIVAAAAWVSGTQGEVAALLPDYLYPRLLSAPAALANFVILGVLISLERAGLALLVQLLLNGCNVALDILLVTVLHWDVAGVAIASAVSEILACAAGVWVLRRALHQRSVQRPPLTVLRRAPGWPRLLLVNRDILIRSACIVGCFYTLPVLGARFGETTLAANGVLMNFFILVSYTLDGFAHAAEVQAGTAYGARDRKLLRERVQLGTAWSMATAVVISAVYAVLGPTALAALTDLPEVLQTAERYLPWLVVSPVLGALAFQMDGVYFGTTHTATLRNAMLLSCALYAGLLFLCVPAWQNHGLWFAFSAFMLSRGLFLLARYASIEQTLPANRAD
ncbi:MAG: MATE family efflux transporter [Pseudomonadota bacterium]